ncbi:MAG: hypothetical protein LVR00_00245 [Rhabdochlamydiaceae bacterium]|jgi:hypothetical protein
MATGVSPLNSPAELWQADYKPIVVETHLYRKWHLPEDTRTAIQVLELLPNTQLPHLPEGHLWFKNQNDLYILRHECASPSPFRIYIFGPDQKERIQYIVTQQISSQEVRTHVFAMARIEGFPAKARKEVVSFKKGPKPYWAGHGIDHHDTLGSPNDPDSSTVFIKNFQPEPPVCWARTLRAHIMKNTQSIDGAYGELSLHGFSPEIIDASVPIPEAVFVETFFYGGKANTAYYVPKNHECHLWAKNGERHFADKAIRKLEEKIGFSPLFLENGHFPPQIKIEEPLDPKTLNVKEAYRLVQAAETEYDGAQYKLEYVLYGVFNQASSDTLRFWLDRVLATALKLDKLYQSTKPPFSLSLLDTFENPLPDKYQNLNANIEELRKLANRVTLACSPLLPSLPPKASESFARSQTAMPALSTAVKKPPALAAAESGVSAVGQLNMPRLRLICRIKPRPLSPTFPLVDSAPTVVICHCDLHHPTQVAEFIEKVKDALKKRSPLILKKVRTAFANEIFPKIDEEVKRLKLFMYRPVQSVEISNEKWRNKVTELTKKYFDENVEITVVKKP